MRKDGGCQCCQSSKYKERDQQAKEAGEDVAEGVEDNAGDRQEQGEEGEAEEVSRRDQPQW